MANIVETHEMVCVDLKDNHNKYYRIELYDNDDVKVQYGRVGYGNSSQQKLYPGIGSRGMHRKINEKKKKGYKEIEVVGSSTPTSKIASNHELKKLATQQICSCTETQKLVEWLTDVNAHNIYSATGGKITYNSDSGLFKTPRGIVTQSAISRARTLLSDIGDFVNNKQYEEYKFIDLLEEFLTIIPQNIGMKKLDPRSFLPDLEAVRKQNDLLDALDTSFATVMSQPEQSDDEAAPMPKLFDTKLEILQDQKEWDRIVKLYTSTANNIHSSYGMKIKRIYKVFINSVQTNYKINGKKFGNEMELWHGTKHCHILSILKGGLVIPPSSSSHVTGRMFSDGIYFALQSSKSLNYATGYWGGARSNRMFMFLCDVALGKYYVPSGPTSKKPPQGYHSYWARPKRSGVMNDEIIVFNTKQCNLKYLLEF